MIAGQQGLGIMLDHNDGIASVPQPLQNLEQPVVISGMKANAWLVQGVGHADQAHAQLGREARSLSLPSTQGTIGAI